MRNRIAGLRMVALAGLFGCGEGTGHLDLSAAGGAGEGGAGAAITLPPEIVLGSDDVGRHGPDPVGLTGGWSSRVGPGSQMDLYFAAGDACLRGQTAQVPPGEYRTYWGAEATFTLCEDEAGAARPASECMSEDAIRQFVGIAFALAGTELPWLVSVQFNEANRETPASIWVQESGETFAMFDRVSDPFDPSSPTVTPGNLESVTFRAAGDSDGVQAFDFCVGDLRALFGDDWEAALVPDWLDDPGPGRLVGYAGANLVGAEFGENVLPGEYGVDYIYPTVAEVDRYTGKGMNVFRIPFRWERMQPALYADLDPTQLGYLDQVIAAAREDGATIIVDPHNFARYEDDPTDGVAPKVIGVDVPIEAFADFWAKLAREYADDDLIWFGLMNEPHDMATETWVAAANAAIAAIRDEGADNLVLVPGNQWTGAHAWFDDYYGTPNSQALTAIVDPENKFAFEIHQYLDMSSSGGSNTCVSDTIGSERVAPVTEWLRNGGYRGFLGEFGGSDDPVCLGAMDDLLNHLGENSDVWLGWAVWAATEWNIQHNIRPQANGEDSLQMQVLLRHLDQPPP